MAPLASVKRANPPVTPGRPFQCRAVGVRAALSSRRTQHVNALFKNKTSTGPNVCFFVVSFLFFEIQMQRGDTWSSALVNYHSAGGSLGKSLVLTAGGGRKKKGHFHNKTIGLQARRRTEDIKPMRGLLEMIGCEGSDAVKQFYGVRFGSDGSL